MSDVVTSAGVLVGLVLAIVSGYAVLDPLLAVVVACNILYQGWKVIARSIDGLMDRAVIRRGRGRHQAGDRDPCGRFARCA